MATSSAMVETDLFSQETFYTVVFFGLKNVFSEKENLFLLW
jgi:hypothetical protein